jgi:cobalt-zinc-cadmium efflux system protein
MEHGHDHQHHSHAIDFEKGNRRAYIIGIGLNLAFVMAELVAGFLNHSLSLLTDAGHNASDVASLVLSLVAFWLAKKRSTAVYTYGYKKTTVLAALLNALILMVAIGVLGYESVVRLFHPQPVEGKTIAWVAGIGIAVNSISAWLFFRHRKKELNARSAYLHLLTDALVSLGVVIAGIVISYTGWYWIDPALGLIIMVVILLSTWQLLRDSFRLTIDAVPSGMELEAIKERIRKMEHVREVEHVHVWPLSTTENALTAKVMFDSTLTLEQMMVAVDKIKHELLHANIHHSTIELGVVGDGQQ